MGLAESVKIDFVVTHSAPKELELKDGNLHPTRGYPLRPAPNGVDFTRSAVIME